MQGADEKISAAGFRGVRSLGIRSSGTRHLARQLITEYGELAGAVARQNAELSLNGDEANRWRQVLQAVSQLHPGPQR